MRDMQCEERIEDARADEMGLFLNTDYPSMLAFALGTMWQDETRLIGGGTLIFGYCDEADDVVGIILAP